MLIKARPDDEKTLVEVTLKLNKGQATTLLKYADMIREKPQYVVGELVDRYLAKDPDFVASLKSSGAFVDFAAVGAKKERSA